MRMFFILLLGLCMMVPLASLAQTFSSSNYQEVSPTIAPGGYATSTSYKLYASVGEIAHSTSTSSSYKVQLGFFSYPFVTTPVVSAVVGNATGRVDLSWTASVPYLGYTVSGYQIGRSTTSGGPYTYTAVGNVLASNITSLTNGTTYYFIVRAQDTNSLPVATSTEISAIPVGPSLTFLIDSGTQTLPALTPGALAATSSILKVNTTNSNGFTITLMRSNAAGTLLLSGDASIAIADKTDWIAPAATTTSGGTTASTTQPTTLQFRLWKAMTDSQNYANSWWGIDDTTSNALFAGIPSTTQVIINSSISATATTTGRVLYDLNVPVTQQTGTYSGAIVYSAVANP